MEPDTRSNCVLCIVALVILVGAPVLLHFYPKHYTATVDFLLNGVLFGVALFVKFTGSVEEAVSRANSKWIPQATSACSRILTVKGTVSGFRNEMQSLCNNAASEIPNFQTDNRLKPVRIMLSTHCTQAANRLTDVSNHLQNAVDDWKRFIEANCRDLECDSAFSEINRWEAMLESQIEEVLPTCDQSDNDEMKKSIS